MKLAVAPEEKNEAPTALGLNIAHVLANDGLKKLSEHRYEEASQIFNVGLKFSPTNANLHFLNGLTYHLLYLRGNEAMRDLGTTGYELALNADPAHFHAAIQLGRLQFYAKRYTESAKAFRRAIEIAPGTGDGYLGLASAAYYAHDLISARAAAEKAAALLPRNADSARASAMIYAALGEREKAQDASDRYAALEQNPVYRNSLNVRVDQWSSWHEAIPSLNRALNSTAVAQTGKDPTDSPNSTRPSEIPTPLDPNGPPAPPVPTRESPAGISEQKAGAVRRAWFDCTDSAGNQTQSQPQGGSTESQFGLGSTDEPTAPIPGVPAPCIGADNPRMVILDVAFIRNEDNNSTNQGVNLLDGLTYVLNAGKSIVDELVAVTGMDDVRTVTTTRSRSRGFPQAGVTYSLNIANSTENHAEILARPSLVALDRMPSTFFSGRNVTLGITGQAGGASSVTDRPIGVSLSVTPTFIDKETILLAVRAQRSFVEAIDANVAFGQTLQTSKNLVSANVLLKMGQTFILSGLSEQEVQRSSAGVPVLKDIPALQYLFNRTATLNFTRSVLVLITPRVPKSDREAMMESLAHIDTLSDSEKRQFRSLIEQQMTTATHGGAPTNLEATYGHILSNTLFLQFRTGDLTLSHWSQPPRLDRMLQSLKGLLYY